MSRRFTVDVGFGVLEATLGGDHKGPWTELVWSRLVRNPKGHSFHRRPIRQLVVGAVSTASESLKLRCQPLPFPQLQLTPKSPSRLQKKVRTMKS
jgi:hypothetical protein